MARLDHPTDRLLWAVARLNFPLRVMTRILMSEKRQVEGAHSVQRLSWWEFCPFSLNTRCQRQCFSFSCSPGKADTLCYPPMVLCS